MSTSKDKIPEEVESSEINIAKEYEKRLSEQIERTEQIITTIDKGATQLNTLWFIAAYMAIILTLILVKMMIG